MRADDIMTLGLGLEAPWQLFDQSLDIEKNPYQLHLTVGAERGALYPCPKCGKLCKAHDFDEMTWRHLNFFQHHCYITARVPRVKCHEHGIHRVNVPWSREGSGFTLFFEQIVMSLVREMPVSKVASHVGISDQRIWRIVHYYVNRAINKLDLSNLSGIALDETASKRGHKYVTVFLDMDKVEKPVIYAVAGKGSECLDKFVEFLDSHGGDPKQIAEVVCDMSPAFLSATEKVFPYAAQTVDWFHVVQIFTRAMDEVRKKEVKKENKLKGARWTLLKGAETERTEDQKAALDELLRSGLATATAFRIKEMLRWVRKADTRQAARWRATNFLNAARILLMEKANLLKPMEKALQTFERHLERILRRWDSLLSNARLEGMNGLFQAARARARGYRNVANFIAMIYLIGAPIGSLLTPQIPQ